MRHTPSKKSTTDVIKQGILIFDDPPADTPHTDLKVAGRTLLQRGIRTMAKAGLERIWVILPQDHPTNALPSVQDLDIQIECTTRGNANVSALALDTPFLLLAGDSVHHHTSLSALIASDLQKADFVAQISDATALDDQRWIPTADQPAPNGQIATGAFLCAPGLFTASAIAKNNEGLWAFLSDNVQAHTVRTEDISCNLWQQVTDKASARTAKDMLFDQVSKSTSGTVARYLNVKISVPFSKLIVDTGISPNMVTFFLVLCPGLLGAYIITQPDNYLRLFVAGLLWQLASILDGCDGEVARVKLAESKFGAWFDTVTDNLAYIGGYSAMIIGMRWLYPDANFPVYAGVSAIASMVLTLGLLYVYALKTGTGSLQYYLGDLGSKVPEDEKDWSYRLLERFGFITKRDFLSLVIAIGLIANQFETVFWFLLVLIHLAALGVLTTHFRLMGDQASEAEQQLQLSALSTAPANREEIA